MRLIVLRILILGFSCSGKTLFFNKLGQIRDECIIHLDNYYWKYPWIKNEKFDILKLISKNNWIIEGTYYKYYLKERLDYCNIIIYLDCNIIVRLYRMIRRHILYLLNPRNKNPISQKINIKFLFITIYKCIFIQPKLIKNIKRNYSNKFIYIKGVQQSEFLMEKIKNENFFELFNPQK